VNNKGKGNMDAKEVNVVPGEDKNPRDFLESWLLANEVLKAMQEAGMDLEDVEVSLFKRREVSQ
jgi:hypothetical protein